MHPNGPTYLSKVILCVARLCATSAPSLHTYTITIGTCFRVRRQYCTVPTQFHSIKTTHIMYNCSVVIMLANIALACPRIDTCPFVSHQSLHHHACPQGDQGAVVSIYAYLQARETDAPEGGGVHGAQCRTMLTRMTSHRA